MIDFSGIGLTGLSSYGEWALGAATLVSALGLPLPATMLLLAAGAFMREGALNGSAGVALAVVGAVLGDSGSYLLGRYGGAMASQHAQNTAIWCAAQNLFRRWGALTIFLSRFWLTPLALPINLIAGSTHYTPWRFLGSVVLGELLWVLIFSGLGYAFTDCWEAISDLIGNLSTAFAGIALLLIVGGYLLRRIMNTEKPRQLTPTQVNLWWDIALFGSIMLALAPFLTGLAIHEWLSIALGVAVVVHLLLHWQWIVATTRRFFGRLPLQARINFALNAALFVNFTVVTFTGLLISQEALPLFGLVLERNRVWEELHRLAADLIVIAMGLHVALHWKWILIAVQRYLLKPVFNRGQTPQPQAGPAPVLSVVRQEVES